MFDRSRYMHQDLNNLYQEGCELIDRYIILDEGPAKDTSSIKAQSELRHGIALLKVVVELYPENWAAHWTIGKGFQALRQREDAYNAFQRAYSINPENPGVAREYAAECIALGKGDEAVEVSRRISESNPEDAGLLSNLGVAYLVAGQVDEAQGVVRKAIEQKPGDRISHNLLTFIQEVKEGKRERPTKLSDF